jgi:hypothetical protein
MDREVSESRAVKSAFDDIFAGIRMSVKRKQRQPQSPVPPTITLEETGKYAWVYLGNGILRNRI